MVGSVRQRVTLAAGLGVALIVALAPAALAAQHAVKIVGFAFTPSSVTVHVGDSVEWTNGDGVTHTATADDASWNTGPIASGTNASVSFDTAGTFAYHCTIHASMHGTVVVVDAAAPPPTDAIDAESGGGPIPDDWPLLGLAAVLGLEVGRRRFRPREA